MSSWFNFSAWRKLGTAEAQRRREATWNTAVTLAAQVLPSCPSCRSGPLPLSFLSPDPSGLGPDSNPYRYVLNSPTNYIDPDGREPVPINPGPELPAGLPQPGPWHDESGWWWLNPWSYGVLRWIPNLISGNYGATARGVLVEQKMAESQRLRALDNAESGAIDACEAQQLYSNSQRLDESTRTLVEGAAEGVVEWSVAGFSGGFLTPGFTPRNARLAGKPHPVTKIPFDENGFPDFSGVSIKTVKIRQTGKPKIDALAANKAAGYKSTPKGYRWHHHQDGCTMELVPEKIHEQTGHTGGVAIIKAKKKK